MTAELLAAIAVMAGDTVSGHDSATIVGVSLRRSGKRRPYVIHGTVAFAQTGILMMELKKGDAIYSDPRLPHDWHKHDHSATTLLMVMTQ